jgi:hypothetical protein
MCLCEDERMHTCACLCARVRTCACMRVYPCARARALVRARARRRWGAGIESRAGCNGIMFRVYALDIKAVIEDGDAPWQLTACAGRGRLELAQLEKAPVCEGPSESTTNRARLTRTRSRLTVTVTGQ